MGLTAHFTVGLCNQELIRTYIQGTLFISISYVLWRLLHILNSHKKKGLRQNLILVRSFVSSFLSISLVFISFNYPFIGMLCSPLISHSISGITESSIKVNDEELYWDKFYLRHINGFQHERHNYFRYILVLLLLLFCG
jgi:hypothetical protein